MNRTATWTEFWQEENAFDTAMSMNYAYFLKHIEPYISLTPQTAVLDLGSGPGHLADSWWNKVGNLTGLDISKRYNDLVRSRHAHHPTVHVFDLCPTNYLNFEMLGDQQFDVIVVMSILQYYPDIAAVETLLLNLKQRAKPGATILLCDLIVTNGMLKDIISALSNAWKRGQLLSMLSLMMHLRFSDYYTVQQNNGFLVIPQAEWLALCKRIGLRARFLPEPVTLQQDRQNLLIEL